MRVESPLLILIDIRKLKGCVLTTCKDQDVHHSLLRGEKFGLKSGTQTGILLRICCRLASTDQTHLHSATAVSRVKPFWGARI
jgi:hypothetical protein